MGDASYALISEGSTSNYNCMDSCIYEDMKLPGSRFCFQIGDLPVKCMNKEGKSFAKEIF